MKAEKEAQDLLKEALLIRKSIAAMKPQTFGVPGANAGAYPPPASAKDQPSSANADGADEESFSFTAGGATTTASVPVAVPSSYMSGKRYQDLIRQVNGQLSLYKSQPKHTRVDPNQVERRLKVGWHC